jgi:hypothetical protein
MAPLTKRRFEERLGEEALRRHRPRGSEHEARLDTRGHGIGDDEAAATPAKPR